MDRGQRVPLPKFPAFPPFPASQEYKRHSPHATPPRAQAPLWYGLAPTTISCGQFLLDTQARFRYISSPKKRVLITITSPHLTSPRDVEATLIADLGDGTLGSAGYNSIADNQLGAVGIADELVGLQFARYNWWGQADDPGSLIQGEIEYTPWLTEAPN